MKLMPGAKEKVLSPEGQQSKVINSQQFGLILEYKGVNLTFNGDKET